MYKIKSTSSGAEIGMTDTPTYITLAANGCFNVCQKPEDASGICFAGKTYNLLGRVPMEGVADTVWLEQIDAGAALAALQQETQAAAAKTGQIDIASKLYVQSIAAELTDDLALEMPDLFRTWEEVLAEGNTLAENEIISDGGQLYRVAQDGVTPQAHQPPHGEGMVAVYRPIEPSHAGTQEDPIPWRYGMDCAQGKYYSYGSKTYLCNLTMPACVWAPDSGIWQWSEVSA